MAEVQLSGPLTDLNFTDDQWQAIFGSNAGVIGDTDGTAYNITLPPATDTVEIGSATIDSRSVVGGYGHLIPAGTTQSLSIPASTNPTIGRTDLIVARFNAATFTTAPGPVRLVRIAGTEGSTALPAHNTTLPSPVDLVLYAITRKQGQGLNQAIVVDRRPRAGWNYLVPPGGSLPQTAPLGARATRDGIVFRRDFDGVTVDWIEESRPIVTLVGAGNTTKGVEAGWQRSNDSRLTRGDVDGLGRDLHLILHRSGARIASASGIQKVATVNDEDRPPVGIHRSFEARIRDESGGSHPASGYIAADGSIYFMWVVSGVFIGPDGPDDTLTIDATWRARS